ncbi:MAG: ABC transporter ATP-binding protein [Lachnospiraceae bacterium]
MNENKSIVIEMKEICKSFSIGERTLEVLKGINLCIQEGEMVAIMGASGCGKSTLLNLIGCLDKITSGMYQLNGTNITKKTEKQMANIRNQLFGYVIQDFALIKEDTVLENIMIPLDYSKKKIPKTRINELLNQFGLSKLKKTRVSLLSGGEQQRVAIARALVNDPNIILADEPTGALDSATGEEVLHILRTICDSGKTVLIVTHDKNIAQQCDRILYMKDGKIA